MTFDIVAIFAAVILSLVALVVLKEIKKEYLPFATSALSIILLIVAFKRGLPLFHYLKNVEFHNGEKYISVLFQVFGIGVLTNIVSELCSDFGIPTLSDKVDFIGKIAIIITALPLIDSLFKLVEEII